jgi:signal transduction histidine kinase
LSALPDSIAATIRAGGFTVAVLTAATLGLAALLLEPTTNDLVQLGIFLPVSAVVSLALALGFTEIYRGDLFHGIRGKLLLAAALSAGLVLVNVGFTAYLMFLSSHDLKLTVLLLAFSCGIAAFFALVTANRYQRQVAVLVEGVRNLGAGQTAIEVHSGDELEDIGDAFNALMLRLNEAAAARRDIEEARRQLIIAVSHDLRTPLATMRAMIESINDGIVTDSETVARYHRTMQAEIAYLSRLIDDLFEVSQLDSGLLQLRRERSSISDLVSDTVEALRPQAEQRNLMLLGEVSPSLPAVEIDVPRMQRVLYNLVQNALRHTPAEGSILIRAFATDDDVRISVEDTGEGLEPHELPRVFDRFYRGDRARSREEAGSGLGLTIARGIVELHGGKIWALSERGQGAAFTFALPYSHALAGIS